MDWTAAALAFLSAVLAFAGFASFRRPAVAARLSDLRRTATSRPESKGASLLIRGDTGLRALLARLGGEQASSSSTIRERLNHAGLRQRSAPGIYYGTRIVVAIALPSLALVIPNLWALPIVNLALILCGLTGAGYVAPSIYLDARIKSRQAGIERALPDALDLMVVCVEAGYGINQALSKVSDEFAAKNPAIASEFALVINEVRTGKPTTDALRGLSERTGVADVSSLVALLVQTEKFGTSVANALRVHADSMRVKRMQRAEQRAQMATLKLILPSTMIFAALLILFMAPAVLRMLEAFPS
jgi:tight adherence protein C